MTVYAVFASVLCGLIAPFYYYDVILLYQLSAYRLKELFTAVKRQKNTVFYTFSYRSYRIVRGCGHGLRCIRFGCFLLVYSAFYIFCGRSGFLFL